VFAFFGIPVTVLIGVAMLVTILQAVARGAYPKGMSKLRLMYEARKNRLHHTMTHTSEGAHDGVRSGSDGTSQEVRLEERDGNGVSAV
jgi:hypothetical protein